MFALQYFDNPFGVMVKRHCYRRGRSGVRFPGCLNRTQCCQLPWSFVNNKFLCSLIWLIFCWWWWFHQKVKSCLAHTADDDSCRYVVETSSFEILRFIVPLLFIRLLFFVYIWSFCFLGSPLQSPNIKTGRANSEITNGGHGSVTSPGKNRLSSVARCSLRFCHFCNAGLERSELLSCGPGQGRAALKKAVKWRPLKSRRVTSKSGVLKSVGNPQNNAMPPQRFNAEL